MQVLEGYGVWHPVLPFPNRWCYLRLSARAVQPYGPVESEKDRPATRRLNRD